MPTKTVTGTAAIKLAAALGLTLSKYADPTEDARDGLSVDEARKVAADDPSLLHVDVEISTAQIRALRSEAEDAMDLVVTHACDVLLGREGPVTDAAAWEERYGGGGASPRERAAVLAIVDDEAALAIVIDAIASAAAMGDEEDA
jgi:hypothetical protein